MLRKIINLIKQVYSYFWKKRKHLKITKPKLAHRPILVRPRKECGLVTKPAAWILKQQRLGLTFSPLTWASSSPTRVSRPSEIDGGTCLSQEQNRGVPAECQNPSSFSPRLFLHPSEQRRAWRPRERERWQAGQRSGTAHEPARRWVAFTRGWARRRRAGLRRCP
jgi:hypothetical protein